MKNPELLKDICPVSDLRLIVKIFTEAQKEAVKEIRSRLAQRSSARRAMRTIAELKRQGKKIVIDPYVEKLFLKYGLSELSS